MKNIISNIKRYAFLMQQLVLRDFKIKYKRSALGIVWSVLYPLLTMLVMAVVFSNIFKAGMEGVNYLVYLLSGLVLFNYFSAATSSAMSSVVSNFSLINKIYIPKYIFPLSKCLFETINFLLTLIPLYLVIICTGTELNVYHLLLPFVYVCILVFSIGMGFFLSAISVFLRDVFYIYGIVITLWTYLTPIMYNITIIPESYRKIFELNPLYQFINFAREIILYNHCPSIGNIIGCIVWALAMLIFGSIVFKKNQDKFIYYI